MVRQTQKKKLIAALFAFAAALALGSCQWRQAHTEQPPPQPEWEAWDYEAAREHLLNTERCIVDLVYNQTPPYNIDLLQGRFLGNFGQAGDEILHVFFDYSAHDEAGMPLYVAEGAFYPTVFHEGIEIAEIRSEVVAVQGVGSVPCQIVVEQYTGTDYTLNGFYRLNFYIELAPGAWVFHHFEGTAFVTGAEMHVKYLPLKEGIPLSGAPGMERSPYEETI